MTSLIDNPFTKRSELNFELPPFSQIREDHYLPAFYEGMQQQLDEVQAILNTPGDATFDNTIVALERSGKILERHFSVDTPDGRKLVQLILGGVKHSYRLKEKSEE